MPPFFYKLFQNPGWDIVV